MTRGSLFAYNILTPPPTRCVRECNLVKLIVSIRCLNFMYNLISHLSSSKNTIHIVGGGGGGGQNIIP